MSPPQNAVKKIAKSPEYALGSLKSSLLFANLPDEEIAYFQNAARPYSYKKDKILYLQAERANNFYVICSGWIKLFHTLPEGEEVIVDMLTTGHIVGESAIFDHGCYTSSAQIVSAVQLLSIPLKVLKERIHLSPKLAFNMLTSMSQHHRRHYGAIALNALQNAPQRIGCFFLSLCPEDKTKAAVFYLPYDKALVAKTLGMTNATFSRALNILRQKTGLRIKGDRVEIDQVLRLVKFVYGDLSVKYLPAEM
jgi:CRP-like cAMP-binding protein